MTVSKYRGMIRVTRQITDSDMHPNDLMFTPAMASTIRQAGKDSVWIGTGPTGSGSSGVSWVLVSYTDLVLALQMILGVDDESNN